MTATGAADVTVSSTHTESLRGTATYLGTIDGVFSERCILASLLPTSQANPPEMDENSQQTNGHP